MVESVLLYGAPVWARALKWKWARWKRRNRIWTRTREEGADRVAIASEERVETERQWQERWSNAEVAAWTRRLIPTLTQWIGRKHGEVGYLITQFLSGHGSFKAYLYKMEKCDTPYCPECTSVNETPEHVLFECPRFERTRAELRLRMEGILTPEGLIQMMVSSEEGWNVGESAICGVMRQLIGTAARGNAGTRQVAHASGHRPRRR